MTLALNLQLLISGLSIGAVYGLVALGLVLTFKASDVLNFAQGEMVAVGAYVALYLSLNTGLSYFEVFGLTLLAVGTLGIVLERLAFRLLIRAPAFTVIIATLAVGLMLKSAIRLTWQDSVYTLPTPFTMEPWRVREVAVNPASLWVILCTALLAAGLALFFRASRLGRAMRAVSQSHDAARLMGINVERMLSLTWAISAAVGAAAGVLLAPLVGITPEMGNLLIKAFAAAILGGFTSLPGAAVGGALVGVVETFAGAYAGSTWKELMAFLLLIVLLLVRPYGLFGRPQARRV